MLSDRCKWFNDENEDEAYAWESACGMLFIFNDEGPIENGFKYCPKCSKEIEVEGGG